MEREGSFKITPYHARRRAEHMLCVLLVGHVCHLNILLRAVWYGGSAVRATRSLSLPPPPAHSHAGRCQGHHSHRHPCGLQQQHRLVRGERGERGWAWSSSSAQVHACVCPHALRYARSHNLHNRPVSFPQDHNCVPPPLPTSLALVACSLLLLLCFVQGWRGAVPWGGVSSAGHGAECCPGAG